MEGANREKRVRKKTKRVVIIVDDLVFMIISNWQRLSVSWIRDGFFFFVKGVVRCTSNSSCGWISVSVGRLESPSKGFLVLLHVPTLIRERHTLRKRETASVVVGRELGGTSPSVEDQQFRICK
jgi:hypothetical protein